MPTTRARLHGWIRDLHLYAGLFLGPLVLVYAVSTLMLNHALVPWGGGVDAPRDISSVRVSVPDAENSLDLAMQLREQLGMPGEVGFVRRRGSTLTFPIESPGRTANVRFDFTSGVATVEEQHTGVWNGLIYLHRMPGPHNANIRGNWIVTRLWGWFADATVYLVLFLSVSGVYLWTALKADRKAGLLFLGAGVLSFVAVIAAIVA